MGQNGDKAQQKKPWETTNQDEDEDMHMDVGMYTCNQRKMVIVM